MNLVLFLQRVWHKCCSYRPRSSSCFLISLFINQPHIPPLPPNSCSVVDFFFSYPSSRPEQLLVMSSFSLSEVAFSWFQTWAATSAWRPSRGRTRSAPTSATSTRTWARPSPALTAPIYRAARAAARCISTTSTVIIITTTNSSRTDDRLLQHSFCDLS